MACNKRPWSLSVDYRGLNTFVPPKALALFNMVLTIQAGQEDKGDSVTDWANIFLFNSNLARKSKPVWIHVWWTPLLIYCASSRIFKFSCLFSQPGEMRVRFDSIEELLFVIFIIQCWYLNLDIKLKPSFK